MPARCEESKASELALPYGATELIDQGELPPVYNANLSAPQNSFAPTR